MKKKLKYLLFVPLLLMLLIIVYHLFFYSILKKEYVKNGVLDSPSTSYFLHSATITAIWVNTARLELGLQYDNKLVEPIILFRDYLFKKGQEQLSDNSAEDVIWWTIIYPRMYGFYGIDKKENNLYIRNLDKKKHQELRLLIKNNIIRLSTLKVFNLKENNFDEYLDILLNGYDISLKSTNYLINENTKENEHYLKNKNIFYEMKDVYTYSRIIFDNKKVKLNYLTYIYNKYRLLSQIIYAQTLYNKVYCNSLYINEFLLYYTELSKSLMLDNKRNNEIDILLRSSFSNDKNQIPIYLLNKIEKDCKQYTNKIIKFKKIINQIGVKYGK